LGSWLAVSSSVLLKSTAVEVKTDFSLGVGALLASGGTFGWFPQKLQLKMQNILVFISG
jgi:hypothetical protein